MDTKTTYFFIGLIALVVALIVGLRMNSDGSSGSRVTQYDGFAQCLGENGATFFGAYWCPVCQKQKALFENSSELPYVECSTPDGQGQTQQCIEEGITGYPTWRFTDGSELTGVVELEELAEKTGCELPQT